MSGEPAVARWTCSGAFVTAFGGVTHPIAHPVDVDADALVAGGVG